MDCSQLVAKAVERLSQEWIILRGGFLQGGGVHHPSPACMSSRGVTPPTLTRVEGLALRKFQIFRAWKLEGLRVRQFENMSVRRLEVSTV